jgi:hypothetical protein
METALASTVSPMPSYILNRATGKIHVNDGRGKCGCLRRMARPNMLPLDRIPSGVTRCSYCRPE